MVVGYLTKCWWIPFSLSSETTLRCHCDILGRWRPGWYSGINNPFTSQLPAVEAIVCCLGGQWQYPGFWHQPRQRPRRLMGIGLVFLSPHTALHFKKMH